MKKMFVAFLLVGSTLLFANEVEKDVQEYVEKYIKDFMGYNYFIQNYDSYIKEYVKKETNDLKKEISNLKKETNDLKKDVSNLNRELNDLKREVSNIKRK
jgi:peptidoglycan hydrolase CwlO-like protein